MLVGLIDHHDLNLLGPRAVKADLALCIALHFFDGGFAIVSCFFLLSLLLLLALQVLTQHFV